MPIKGNRGISWLEIECLMVYPVLKPRRLSGLCNIHILMSELMQVVGFRPEAASRLLPHLVVNKGVHSTATELKNKPGSSYFYFMSNENLPPPTLGSSQGLR